MHILYKRALRCGKSILIVGNSTILSLVDFYGKLVIFPALDVTPPNIIIADLFCILERFFSFKEAVALKLSH
jgi:hypothetical protein